jgi:chemotaxis protein MotB
MTTLMIFFLILYAFALLKEEDKSLYEEALSAIQEQFGGEKNIERIERARRLKQEKDLTERMKKFVKDKNLKKFVEVNMDEERIKIVMQNPILFDVGKAELKPSALRVLDEVATLIKYTTHDVVVEGHTDNVPISTPQYPSNWELSAARAFSVINYFIKEKNIAPTRLSACGYGEYRPVAPNDTPENRALNRRIEISILRKGKK